MLTDQDCLTNASKVDFFINSEGEICVQGEDFDYEDGHALRKNELTSNEFVNARLSIFHHFVNKVDAFARICPFSRFRVYGQCHEGKELIVVCTEFCFQPNSPHWDDVEKVAITSKANVWIMRKTRSEMQVELAWQVQELDSDAFKKKLKYYSKVTQDIWNVSGLAVC